MEGSKGTRSSGYFIVPMWESSTWWHLVTPMGRHLSEFVVDWVWLPRGDPVEVALAARVQHSAMAHVAGSTSKGYVGPWNMFVKWCGERLSERCPLPASDFTVALYLQSVADSAKTFAPVKSHSAAIAFFQKINLFNHLPTQSPALCMIR